MKVVYRNQVKWSEPSEVTWCYSTKDKLQPDGPLSLCAEVTLDA